MDAIEAGTVGPWIIAHKDHLTHFGYEWFERFADDGVQQAGALLHREMRVGPSEPLYRRRL
jgi:hypothetical protein